VDGAGLLAEEDRGDPGGRTNLDAFSLVRGMADELVDQEGFAGSGWAGQKQIVALLEEGKGMGLVSGQGHSVLGSMMAIGSYFNFVYMVLDTC